MRQLSFNDLDLKLRPIVDQIGTYIYKGSCTVFEITC